MRLIICTLLTAVSYYFSIGLGEQWWLAWLAPIPILWLAFGDSRGTAVFFGAWAAMALGSTSLLRAYGGVLPNYVLVVVIGVPSLLFALSVMGARRVQRRVGPIAAMFAFAAVWAAFDFLNSFGEGGGAVQTPAAAEVGRPELMQSAALVGFVGVTFLLGVVAAGVAASLRTRRRAPLVIALSIFIVNAAYGTWRVAQPASGSLRVALVDSDAAMGALGAADQSAAFKVIDAYVGAIDALKDAQPKLVVLPENIALIAPEWREQAQAKLAAAANRLQATVVAGFNTPMEGARRNVSWAFSPGADSVVTYEKRRLVPVLETNVFAAGPGPRVLASGIGLEICKDMDFHRMLRADEVATTPRLLAVPAWDFHRDDWSHARVAVMRSVENGVPMARAARNGLLTLNDRYGRLVARARTTAEFSTLVGELPLDGHGGATVYDRIGDAFAWSCAAFGFGLVAVTWLPKRPASMLKAKSSG
jgi:apolipoprotein N-acyltransferase